MRTLQLFEGAQVERLGGRQIAAFVRQDRGAPSSAPSDE
jgi:hypothetical protein